MLVDNDSFDQVPLSARQARFAPWCSSPQAYRNATSGQGNPASGGARRLPAQTTLWLFSISGKYSRSFWIFGAEKQAI